MKNLTLALGFLSSLSASVFAQDLDGRDAGYKDLSLGDRVEIQLRNNSTIMGTLAAPSIDPKAASIDYGRATALTLDLSLEYPGVNGAITIAKTEIRAVRILQPLTREQRAEKERIKRLLAAEQERPKTSPTPAPETAPAPAPKPVAPAAKDEDLKKAEEIYRKFPAPDWSPERHNAIRLKTARGQALTAMEAEFDQNFALWEKGRAAAMKAPADPKKP